MWTVSRDLSRHSKFLRIQFSANNRCLSYAEFLDVLQNQFEFRDLFFEQLRMAPFSAFRWETPPLTPYSTDQPFECLLHDSPDLNVPADPTDFAAYFESEAPVVSFNNLGADALLVVPCPISAAANYSHIAAFHRTAPASQQHALWVRVSQEIQNRNRSIPLWLNTAGGGVDWLHVRLDSQPKYYRYLPWREAYSLKG